jgi:hypothetical protein
MGQNLRIGGGSSVTVGRGDSQGPTTFEAAVAAQFDYLYDLLLRKHQNYGPLNILQSPGSALNGLRVRVWDKLARINHMIDHDVEDAVGEPLLETFGDLANYGVIGRLVILDQFGLPMGKP